MHINDIDLNLLRLFDAVYRLRSVSRAAESLGLTQPAVSQGLTRLRLLVKDPLFLRAPGGVRPSPMADRLADAVAIALRTVEQAFSASTAFEPLQSRKTFRLHMSDIGASRFLPPLMAGLRERAPGVRVDSSALPAESVSEALDSGRIDFAIGFLPSVKDTQRVELLQDRYVVLLRAGHPLLPRLRRRRGAALLQDLQQLEFVAVRTHSDTLRILQLLQLDQRLRLTTEHFMVLPAIVRATDLGVVMPRQIAQNFAETGDYAVIEPTFPLRDFTVSLHWSKRFESDPAQQWMRALMVELLAG